MALLAPNIEALKRFPVTSKLIIQQKDTSPIDPGLHPYGKSNKKDLIDRWIGLQTIQENQCYALAGFGDGCHIEALLDSSPKNSFFLIAEASSGHLQKVLSEKDCSKILKDPRVALVTGEMNNDFFETLGGFPLFSLNGSNTFRFSPLHQINTEYYDSYFNEFHKHYSFLKNLHTINIKDAGLWHAATLINLPSLINASDVSITEGLFKDIPIVLVAAGPSLDASIPFLKEVQNNAIIVCVNSAYRKLYNEGIHIHITLAGDPRLSTFKGYEGCKANDCILMAPFFVHPKVIEFFNQQTLTWNNQNTLLTYIRSKLGENPGTQVFEKGTIAACIVDLARLWGTTKVCLVGQDLAIQEDGQSHTKDSFYQDDNRLHLNLKDCVYMPGNTRKEVPVHRRLIDFLKTFNEIIPQNKGISFVNTSAMGAKIQGAPYKSYEEARRWIGPNTLPNISEVTQKYSKKDISSRIEVSLQSLLSFCQVLKKQASTAALYIEFLPKKYEAPTYENNQAVKKSFEQAKKINYLLNQYPKEYDVLYNGPGKKEMFHYSEEARLISHPSKHWEDMLKNKAYFWALAESAHFLLYHLEQAIPHPANN